MPEIQPFITSRVFNAPRNLVYAVHTKPEHIARWFGPAGTKVLKFDMDFRVGGVNHYGIVVPPDVEMWGKQVYKEIVPLEKVVHVQSFSDKDGKITRHPMSPSWPAEMLATTTFTDEGKGCKVTVSWLPYNSDEASIATFDGARDSMSGGFKGMFDNLEAYIKELA